MKKVVLMLFAAIFVLFGCSNSDSTSEGEIPVVSWITIGKEPTDQQMVEDTMNEILVADYGVMVDFTYIDYPEYSQNVGLKISSGEPMDIIFAPSWSLDFDTYAKQGSYYDMTELVKASEMYENIDPAFWSGVTVDGKIYGIPTDKEIATTQYMLIPTKYVEEYNLDLSTMDSADDFIPYMKEWTADYGLPAYTVDAGWKGGYKLMGYDCIGALDYQVCLDPAAENPEYKWIYDYPEYVAFVENMDAYIEEGLLKADAVNLVDFPTATYPLVIQEGPPGSVPGWEASFGEEFEAVEIEAPLATTDSVRGSINVISATSTQPEAAFTVLEAFNTDPRLRNLYAHGIEGVHYTLDENGQVVYTDAHDQYLSQIYTQGDFTDLYTTAGEPVDKMEQIETSNESATISPALGFNPDLSEYQAEVANIMNIFQKYKVSLYNFEFANPVSEDLVTYRAELDSVGFTEVINEINKQYDAFMAAQ